MLTWSMPGDLEKKVKYDTKSQNLDEGYIRILDWQVAAVWNSIRNMELNPAQKRLLYMGLCLTAIAVLSGCSEGLATPTPTTEKPVDTGPHILTPEAPTLIPATATPTARPTDTLVPPTCIWGSETIRGTSGTMDINTGRYLYPGEDVVSMITKPLTDWNEREQKIGDGEPVYQQAKALMASPWVRNNGLNLDAVFVGKGCGWSALLKNPQGNYVWATDENGAPMYQPNGVGGGAGLFEFSGPPGARDGRAKMLVGKDRQAVWVLSNGQISDHFDEVHRVWIPEGIHIQFTDIPATPSVIEVTKPAGVGLIVINGYKVEPTFNQVESEWQWVLNGKVERVFDQDSQKQMAYSRTVGGSMVIEVDVDNGFYIDANTQGKNTSEKFARLMITNWGNLSGVDVSQVKGFKFKIGFSKNVDTSKWIRGVDYADDVQLDSYLMKPKLDKNGYMNFVWWLPEDKSMNNVRNEFIQRKYNFLDIGVPDYYMSTMLAVSLKNKGVKVDSGYDLNNDPDVFDGEDQGLLSLKINKEYSPTIRRLP